MRRVCAENDYVNATASVVSLQFKIVFRFTLTRFGTKLSAAVIGPCGSAAFRLHGGVSGKRLRLLARSNNFIDADGGHEQDDKKKEAEQSPGPAHILFYDDQHDYRYQEDGGNFVPDTQLL